MRPDAPVAVPDAQPLNLQSVTWQALTLSELQKLVAALEERHQNTLLIALDTTNYNNLSVNLAELNRFIKEQKAIITMLKTIIAARADAPSEQGRRP
jgi:hypothetical protein